MAGTPLANPPTTAQPVGIPSSAAATLARISAIVVPKRTRASRPKVKTGCSTCKKRHVKCDERRPVCLRCEQGGLICAGYPPVTGEIEVLPAKTKLNKMAMVKSRTYLAQRLAAGATMPTDPRGYSLLQPNAFPIGLKEGDGIYYDLYRTQLAHDLAGHMPSDFWSGLVMRESVQNDCVRHCIIAIAALSQSLDHETDGQMPRYGLPSTVILATEPGRTNNHSQRAIFHYTKAMSLFRQRMSTGTEVTRRNVLITTLLFVAYELLQGDTLAATNLINSGMVLLKDSMKMLQPPGAPPPERRSDGDDMNQIEHLLTRTFVSVNFTPFSSPHGTLPDVKLITTPYVDIPALGQTSIHQFFQLWSEFSTRMFLFIKDHVTSNLLNEPVDLEAAKRDQLEYLRRLELWGEALHAFMEHGRVQLAARASPTSPSSSAGSRAVSESPRDAFTEDVMHGLGIVQIHLIMGTAFVRGCLDQTSLTFDEFDDAHRSIIALSTPYVATSASRTRSSFMFDIMLTPMLGFVLSYCRNRALRMEALDLYRRMTWREGAWDNRALLIGKRALIELEHSGADETGFVPPKSRYVWTGSSWDGTRKKLIATYHRLVPDENGKPVTKVLLLDVPDTRMLPVSLAS